MLLFFFLNTHIQKYCPIFFFVVKCLSLSVRCNLLHFIQLFYNLFLSSIFLFYVYFFIEPECLGLNLRDRCGSLPTHNRTTSDGTAQLIQNQSMPPPRTIPLAITGRPHSMYTNSYRHSPPVNSNHSSNQPVPLSPRYV